jgi:hypothetical protein
MIFDTFDRTGQAELPFPKQVVFRALCDAVDDLKGMTIENRDELASRLDIKTGMSPLSWGEKVSVSVSANGDQAGVISVQSAAKTVFGSGTTHAKNRKNVRQIITRTSELLQEHGSDWRSEMGLEPATSTTTATPSPSLADELRKLAELRDQGVLNPEEFETQKQKLLNGS